MAKSNQDSSYPSCFVCGCRKTGAYPLFIRQIGQPGPYFPFLETHEPPDGAELPTKCGKVLSCYACYAFLIQQWESYEKNKVPLVKRIYWLKRVDNGPYTGVEMGMQSEYASQVFGVTSDNPGQIEVKKHNSTFPKMEPVHVNPLMSPHLSLGNTNDSITSTNPQSSVNKKQDIQHEALDLSVERSPERKRKFDGCNAPEAVLKKKTVDSFNAGVLDLSMPDKNAATEVCYVCGNQFEKGTLSDIFAKNFDRFNPFFPSLMLHSRPSGSRPMEPSGKVSGCEDCLSYLLSQWKHFENLKVPYDRRKYCFNKQSNLQNQNPKNICFKCGKIKNPLQLIHCIPNSEAKPYYPTHLSSSPTLEGYICNDCVKEGNYDFTVLGLKPNRIKSFKSENSNQRSHSLVVPSESNNSLHKPQPFGMNSELDLGLDCVSCCLCHQSYSLKQMQTLSMVPDPSNSSEMFFPFLKFLPRVNQNMITEDGRILACKACYSHLRSQWLEYEKDSISPDQRHFSLRALSVESQSPRLTPISNYTPPPHPLSGKSTPTENSMPPFNNMPASVSVASNSKDAIGDVSKKSNEGYHGQSLKELEVVAATSEENNNTLLAITTQRALNVNINCYICGFQSKTGQTYAVKSQVTGKEMFFPFLNKHVSTYPEAAVDSSTYLVCLICFHSLVIQWQHYEKNRIEYHARFYDTYNFSCYICGMKTYRKRLYLLPVKDYPFLKEHVSPSGGMVVNNGHSVVVCKDCYLSLNDQYVALERLGVPVEKRQYNWIQRPPPPEFGANTSGTSKPKITTGNQNSLETPTTQSPSLPKSSSSILGNCVKDLSNHTIPVKEELPSVKCGDPQRTNVEDRKNSKNSGSSLSPENTD